MTRTNTDVLIAFESAEAGEKVEILQKGSGYATTGYVIEKSPIGYYDRGWCIRLKIDTRDEVCTEEGSIEIFRENIESIRFLRKEEALQLSLPFEDNHQLHLGI